MRGKQVFDSNEIAHLWMHKTQRSATNKQHNFYFVDDTIYSYSGHFPIARHVDSPRGPAVFFTTRGYSSTTSKHICAVRQAIPNDARVFHTPDVYLSSAELATRYASDVEQARKELTSAKIKSQVANRWRTLQSANEFNAWACYKPRFKEPANADELNKIAAEWDETCAVRRANAEIKRLEKWADWQVKQERERSERAAKVPEIMDAWKRGENPASIAWWEYNQLPTMLRVVGNEIETSRGARFPIEHARHALPLIRKVWESGEGYVRNGHTIHLGHYAIDKVTSEHVIAGCHVVDRAEVERIASLIGA